MINKYYRELEKIPIKVKDLIEKDKLKLAPMILKLLSNNPDLAYTVEDLIAILKATKSEVYHATSSLWQMNLISKENRGRTVYYYFKPYED